MQQGAVLNSQNKRTAEKVIVVLTAAVIIGILLLYLYRSKLLKDNGVYVIGKVISVRSVENGYIAKIDYWYQKNKYSTARKTLPAIKDKFVFLMISQGKPGICSLITDRNVPECLSTSQIY